MDILGLETFYFTDPNFRDLSNPASVDVKEENLCSCDKAGTITVTISVAYPLSDNELRDVKVTIDGRKAPINSTDKNTSATKGKTLEICPSGLQSGTIDVEMSSSGGSIEIADDPGNNNPGTKLTVSYSYECETKDGECSTKSNLNHNYMIK